MSEQELDQNNQGFNIELPEELANGVYSNLAIVMNSQSEFVLDFIRLLPGTQAAKVQSRVIMTPDNLKRFVRVLQGNINAYEQQIAPIILPEDMQQAGGNDFGQGQA